MIAEAATFKQQSQTKLCTSCRREQSIAEFRLQRSSGKLRRCQCRSCYNDEMRAWRAERRKKRIRKSVKGVRSRRTDARSLALFVNQVAIRFGGVDGLADAWCEAFREARAGKDRWLVHEIIDAILAATVANDQLEQAERDFETSIRQILKEQPELAISAAEQLGWKLTPPNEPADDDEG